VKYRITKIAVIGENEVMVIRLMGWIRNGLWNGTIMKHGSKEGNEGICHQYFDPLRSP